MMIATDTTAPLAEAVLRRFRLAEARRGDWESLWQDAYSFALPSRNAFGMGTRPGENRMDDLYDATAMDAVEELAASLMGNLTPAWTQWFGLKPGPDLSPYDAQALAPALEQAGRTLQAHFDRSNFTVEIHQAYLDLIVGGTAALNIDEAEPGAFSAFRFASVPLSQIVLEEGVTGLLDGAFRTMQLTLAQLKNRYPFAPLPEAVLRDGLKDAQGTFDVLESILPQDMAFNYVALLLTPAPVMLRQATLADNPLIAFRWLKSPGEIYGRSPVMKALPDIKTANKVVELILKNASIAVTGIWQADDDGVLNPANIQLKPGAIIPKAVGSQGLKPLEMPGRFDISQLVLTDLRARIRHALLVDKLAPIQTPRMTATEVLERASDMAMVLGATYGRLQCELLTPLVKRAFAILAQTRRGAGRGAGRAIRAARLPRAAGDGAGPGGVQNTLSWITSVLAMGPAAASAVNLPAAARYLGQALGVPADLIAALPPPPLENTDAGKTVHENAAAAVHPAGSETAGAAAG